MKNPSCSKCLKKFMKIKRNDGGDEGDLTLEVSRTSELPLKDMILLTILPLST